MSSTAIWYIYLVIVIILFVFTVLRLSAGAYGRAALSGVICAYFAFRLYMMSGSEEGRAWPYG